MAKTSEPRGLLEEFEEAGGFIDPRRGVCSVCSHPDREDIDIILRREGSSEALSRVLSERGTPISGATLRRHKVNHL